MEDEFWEIEDKQHGWYKLFQQLYQVALSNAGTQLIAKEPMNVIRNRYRDVLPIDDTRVKLKDTDCDYINANYVKEPSVDRSYILSQGPMGHTSSHFWQMVWDQDCAGIVMLNRCIEKGMNKCFQYWPPEIGQSVRFGPYTIENQYQQAEETFTLSVLTLTKAAETSAEGHQVKTVHHFHYLKWPDFNVPRTPDDFLQYLYAVRKGGVLSPERGPCVVHCSAGIGRSGTFCLADIVLAQIEKTGTTEGINIQQTLLDLRTQRFGLIQTLDQLRFAYVAILHGVDRALKGEDGEDEDSLSDEGVASESDNEEMPSPQEGTSGFKRRVSEDEGIPPPLPPRMAGEVKKPHVNDDDTIVCGEDEKGEGEEEEEKDKKVKQPFLVPRTTSLIHIPRTPSVTPEPATEKGLPPPLPPKNLEENRFLGGKKEGVLLEREEEDPSAKAEENLPSDAPYQSTSENDRLRRRGESQEKQVRIKSQVESMQKKLQTSRGHQEHFNPVYIFAGVAVVVCYLLYQLFY